MNGLYICLGFGLGAIAVELYVVAGALHTIARHLDSIHEQLPMAGRVGES
jgi:hypothetical protein